MNYLKQLTALALLALTGFTASAVDISLLSIPEQSKFGYTYKATVNISDVTNAVNSTSTNTASPINIFPGVGYTTFPTGQVFSVVGMRLITPFLSAGSGGDASITSVQVSVGDDTKTNRYLKATELYTSNSPVYFSVGGATSTNVVYTTATNLNAYFITYGGASPSGAELTAGKVEFYIRTHNLRELNGAP